MPARTSTAPAWRLSSLILVAIAAGILTGLSEAAFLQVQRLVFGRMVFMGRHAWWMKPAAESVLFAAIASLWLLPAGLRQRTPRVVATLVSVLAVLSLLLMIPQLHPAAQFLLAVGFGVQAGRIFDRWLGSREALARRLAFGLMAFTVLIAAGSQIRPGFGARGAARPEEGSPNILLLVLDTVRASSLSAFGHSRPTSPTLERLAAQGVLWERAISPAPWTLPSHASMFTGLLPRDLTADWRQPLDDAEPTIAEHLSDVGYRTAGFVANMGYCGWETGLQRGFQHYEDHPVSIRAFVVESSIAGWALARGLERLIEGGDENFVRKSAADVNESFLRWLDREEDGPFFAFLNYYDAHGPYQPPEPYRSDFGDGDPRGGASPLDAWLEDPFGEPPSNEDIGREFRAYEAAIASLNAQIGRLVEELERRGQLDNTVLVVTSDHGEEFGEHGVYDHGNSLYLEGVHVPLMIRYPRRVPAGIRVSSTVSTRHLAATIADLAGSVPGQMPGESLVSVATEADGAADAGGWATSEVSFAARLPEWFPVSRGDMASFTTAEWHLVRNGDGQLELYDLRDGSDRGPDLAGEPRLRGLVDSLEVELSARIGAAR